MPFDREGALKSAEKALRQGRVDAAIAEYLKVVEAQPRDWNSANALGDLYVRSSQVEKGLAEYTRIADHLDAEGFYPKAAALYKKIVKIRPGEEPALLKLGEIAARQGLLGDAKQYFHQVAERRKSRGDRKGAAELSIRLGTLDPEDLDSRLGAARAAVDMGDTPTALREFRDVAERMAAAAREDERINVLVEVAAIEPTDLDTASTLANAFVARGDLARARQYLTERTAGSNAKLWLTLAEMELTAGRVETGRAAVARAISLDPQQREAAVVLGCRLAETSAEAGYPVIDVVADAALLSQDYAAAAAALHEFVTRVRFHLVALMRLVDICVDGGLEATMYETQAQLADAYLEVGRGLEARIISEDLVAREPWNRANIERFRRSLVMLGESDPDAIIADRLSGDSPFMAADFIDLNEGVDISAPLEEDHRGDDRKKGRKGKDGGEPGASSISPGLSASGGSSPGGSSVPSAASMVAPVGVSATSVAVEDQKSRSLGQVFKDFREELGRHTTDDAAAEQYRLAITYQDMGMSDDAIVALETAARSPRQRFDAASMLGRLYLDRGDSANAIAWFQRAAEAPAPTTDASRALLYDLGETLEAAGEGSRALAVFAELEAESGGYRDVTLRIARLSKVQARG